MSPKRAPKASSSAQASKKAPRPTSTKKKQAPLKQPVKKKESQPLKVQKPKPAPKIVTQHLASLLKDPSAPAESIVNFVVEPTCGLESLHNWSYFEKISPFLLAVEAGRLDVVQLLVSKHSANTKAVAVENLTALHIASQNGNIEMVRYLVEQCGLDVQAVDVFDRMSLYWALFHSHSDVALLLLELGADPKHPNRQGWTPLHWACMRGLVDVARVLIAKGASQDTVDAQSKTPLDIAVEWQHSEVAALFGARPGEEKM